MSSKQSAVNSSSYPPVTDHCSLFTAGTAATKAMVLAAGLGTRLRPLTDGLPKCMMPLAGKPLIDWTLRWLKRCSITECVINLHYLPEVVKDFVGNGAQYGLEVHYSYEPELLGTAGAVRKVAEFFDEPFFVIYSDNFSQWDLTKLKAGCASDVTAVMAVHWREEVTQSGMVETDEEGRILRIVEKPSTEDVTSHFVNAGFLYLDPKVLDYIPVGVPWDFSYQVFPQMLEAREKLCAVRMDMPIIGIDTTEAYEQANKYAQTIEAVRSEGVRRKK